ncbi:MAG: elongation factor 4 [Candidatus Magasanikbacteria bacterium]|nr:elongation factor 4 [Candidatus Magasanikbacteria bacterium]
MNIRNFCIIAHIDHGKSTLADRFLELTGTVSKRDMKEQVLDSMDLERERGITIKLTPVRMNYTYHITRNMEQSDTGHVVRDTCYVLNLIDTPGHVDFNYEVSRSLAAVEGAILLVDATQGVQAQTIGNLYLALEQNLTIIPVLNKIDMPIAEIEKTKTEIIHLLGCKEEEILMCSAKTGQGVEEALRAVIERVPPPRHCEERGTCLPDRQASDAAIQSPTDTGSPRPCVGARDDSILRALIFDSTYDDYRGVVAAVRIVSGEIKKGQKIKFMRTGAIAEALEVGHYAPEFRADPVIASGLIGYVVTGLKDLKDVRVGDTITLANSPAHEPLPGYKEIKPMVFAGIFPQEGDDYNSLRDAVDRLKLSDASLFYEPEHSQAMGFGFRCGFLGMLHLDIFQERLKREFGLRVVVTVPSVAYKVLKTDGKEIIAKSPQDMPEPNYINRIEEPWMSVDVITPQDYIGNVMGLIAERKGRYLNTEYLSAGAGQRAMLHYELPLASLITDFYDKLKTVTSGYGSLNYEFKRYEKTDVIKMDILVAEEKVEPLATLIWRDSAFKVGKQIVNSLKDTLPKQQFVVKIQAAIGGKIIAAERLSALRKDVTAKLYGGDVTRKNKLLEKQKKGKKKMLAMGKGKVDIPTEAYLAVLKR